MPGPPGLGVVPSEIALGQGLLSFSQVNSPTRVSRIWRATCYSSASRDNVECRIGRARYTALYLVSGTIGVLAHVATAIAMGGAAAEPLNRGSAHFGVLAAYLVLFPGNKIVVLLFFFIPTVLSAWLVIGLWFIIQVMGGFQGSRRRNGIHRPYWRIRLGLALGAPLQEARARRIERKKRENSSVVNQAASVGGSSTIRTERANARPQPELRCPLPPFKDSPGRDRIVSMLTAEEGFSMPSSSEEPQFTEAWRRLSCSVGTHLFRSIKHYRK